ncbi:serine/threonine-protein kinase [Nocardia sp. NPDC056611]|uniref:serine/threonine-protein kinase n=1 Tax=Nocardia sp. NPDC056611 TaxID=3345877 RepID=UPI00366F2DF6
MVLVPGAVFAGFTIEALLGSGGMGEVYRARHPRLPRHVAIKVLTDTAARDASFRLRFDREGALAARVNHRNLVTVYDRGIDGDRPWICMEYVPGQDVSALIRRRGGVPHEQAVYIVGQAALGIDHAHRQGLLHRDIKPANILLAPGDPGEGDRVLVSDFGIARSLDESRGLTSTGGVVATLAYAPPEAFTGEPLSPRADIYALGATLFEMLTGSVPYPRTTPAAIIHAQLSAPPPRPSDLRPDLPRGFDEVIARAMAKDPAHRFASARELAEAATAALRAAPRPAPAQSFATPDATTLASHPPQPDTSAAQQVSNARSPDTRDVAWAGYPAGAAPPPMSPAVVPAPAAPEPPRTSTGIGPERPAPKTAPPERSSSSRRTGRRMIVAGATVAVVSAGLAGLGFGYHAIRSQYYVGVDGEKVVVLRGSPGTVAGFTIREVDGVACVDRNGGLRQMSVGDTFPTGCVALRRSDLRESARADVEKGLPPGDRGAAMQAMRTLVETQLLPPCDRAASPGSGAPLAPPTTTTVPAPTLGVPATTAVPVTSGQNCRAVN